MCIRDRNSPVQVKIGEPKLWWPNGYGEQNLYQVKVTLFCDGRKLDEWCKRIGLRTMTMHIEKDEWGECFAHQVNGVDVFAMGADYIPEDNLLAVSYTHLSGTDIYQGNRHEVFRVSDGIPDECGAGEDFEY